MDLLNGFIKLFSRLFGFSLIAAIMTLAVWTFSGLPPKIFLLLASIVFMVCWAIYSRFVGSLEGDVAILIRLIMAKSGGFLSFFSSVFSHVASLRTPVAIPFSSYEIVEWNDVETNNSVRRALSRGRLTCLLGQYDGKPRFIDLAEAGQIFVSSPPRSGKTNLITQIVATILLGHPLAKKEIDFIFIDITRDLSLLRPLGKYTPDMVEARKILSKLGDEVDRRNALREKYRLGGGYWYEIPLAERPKMTVLVIDEAIQVIEEGGAQLKAAWSKLINTGHKNGILIITTVLYNRGDLIPTEFFALMYAKIAGYMGTDQALTNVTGSDYYSQYKEEINAYVNQKYRFLLCIRGKKPSFFQPIYVSPQKLSQLIESAVLDPSAWQEVALTIWWNKRGDIGVQELADQTRNFVQMHAPDSYWKGIHKVSTLELMHHAIVAGIATHNGSKKHFLIAPRITSYGALLDSWSEFVNSGGLEKKAPTGAQLAKQRKAA